MGPEMARYATIQIMKAFLIIAVVFGGIGFAIAKLIG